MFCPNCFLTDVVKLDTSIGSSSVISLSIFSRWHSIWFSNSGGRWIGSCGIVSSEAAIFAPERLVGTLVISGKTCLDNEIFCYLYACVCVCVCVCIQCRAIKLWASNPLICLSWAKSLNPIILTLWTKTGLKTF